jgi:hypothetical protein
MVQRLGVIVSMRTCSLKYWYGGFSRPTLFKRADYALLFGGAALSS